MNWDAIILAAIAGLPGTLVAAAAFLESRKTHKAVNSRMTELIRLARLEATDDATRAEKKAERVRRAEAKKLGKK